MTLKNFRLKFQHLLILGVFLLTTTLVFLNAIKGLRSQNKAVSYIDAASYVGQIRTVRTLVKYAFMEKGKEMFFSSRTLPHHAHMVPEGGDKTGFFTIAIPLKAFDLFPASYVEKLRGKNIEVTGKVTWFQGDVHMIVTDPKQIRVID